MFTKNTVLVLGAGASCHYGYPTGEGLIDRIVNTIKTKEFPSGAGSEKMTLQRAYPIYGQLCERLEFYDPLSIDNFLSECTMMGELVRAGKTMIAYEILQAEDKNWLKRFHPSVNMQRNENWYRFLIHALTSNATKHLVLNRTPRTGQNPPPALSGGNSKLEITDGALPESVAISSKYNIATNAGDMDAYGLALQCVCAWEYFIKTNIEKQTAITAHQNISYRPAQHSDICGIFCVLETVAPEIPLRLDTTDRRALISQRISESCTNNTSWVAVIPNNQVVGILLSEPDITDTVDNALCLSYIAVVPTYQGQHIFSELVRQVMSRGMPLTAEVKYDNKSCMTNRLTKLGFTRVAARRNNEDRLQWIPPA